LNSKRLAIGVFLGLTAVTGGILALTKVVTPHERVFQGKSAGEWREELGSGDAAASNRAIIILNTAIIPELSDAALHDTNDSGFKLAVVNALNQLPGVRLRYLNAPGRRGDAVKELGKFGPAAAAAVPVLIQILKGNDDPSTRGAAAAALGEIHGDPDVAIPALIVGLEDSDVNDQAAEALGKFGALAKVALPKLLPLLHGGKEARHAATLALPKIDSEAAAKAGIPGRTIKSAKDVR
jgi:hypothetical protein